MIRLQSILASLAGGFLSTMNVWAYKLNHVSLTINDVYMVLLMTFWMIVLMNFKDLKILIISIIGVTITIILIRTQTFVNDRQYLSNMITHHSMAMLMSDKILQKTNNPRIIKLANTIFKSQQQEINEMKKILDE